MRELGSGPGFRPGFFGLFVCFVVVLFCLSFSVACLITSIIIALQYTKHVHTGAFGQRSFSHTGPFIWNQLSAWQQDPTIKNIIQARRYSEKKPNSFRSALATGVIDLPQQSDPRISSCWRCSSQTKTPVSPEHISTLSLKCVTKPMMN